MAIITAKLMFIFSNVVIPASHVCSLDSLHSQFTMFVVKMCVHAFNVFSIEYLHFMTVTCTHFVAFRFNLVNFIPVLHEGYKCSSNFNYEMSHVIIRRTVTKINVLLEI